MPVVVDDSTTTPGTVLESFKEQRETEEDDVIDQAVLLVRTESLRLITGAYMFGAATKRRC